MSAISIVNLGKCYHLYPNRWRKLSAALLSARGPSQDFWALRSVHFEIPEGASLGIIGPNGAGKTTLLQLLAGLIKPTEGAVEVRGTLATLLELGSAFNMELTGRENIFVSAGLQGFSRKEIQQKTDEIIAFAELEEFIDQPARHYSTGMLMRLAFATAINVKPSVLLADEIFSVGDTAFQHKCVRRFRELQAGGTTVVLVSHDITAVKSFCNYCLLLDHGAQVQFGQTEEVTNRYLSLVAEKIARQEAQAPEQAARPASISSKAERHGSGEGRITAVEILDTAGRPLDTVPFGEEARFRFTIEYNAEVEESILGFFIRDRYGNDIIGINTIEEGKSLGSHRKGDRLSVEFRLPLRLREGNYSISPGLSYHRTEPRYLDWVNSAAFFQMGKPPDGSYVHGFFHVPNQVRIEHL